MQSKGFIKLIAALLALACVYQLSFTFKTRNVEKKAAEYAAQFDADQRSEAEQHYLDSVQNLPVYNLLIKSFTYKECKEKELNLGLDLKGGMNVMLEVQVQDVIKALAGSSQHDPAFVAALAEADEALRQGTSKDYIGDFVKAYQKASNGAPLAAIFVSPDRKDITLESSDAEVEKLLKNETEAAIAASFNVLRSRIDHFGVTQPNIMRLPNSHRILVELPGVKEPQRVRDLLQGTASLEFWTTYDANEVWGALQRADQVLREQQAAAAEAPAAATEEETAAGEQAEGLIAEVEAAVEEETEAAGNFDRTVNPLFAVLDPNYAGGAAIGAAYKADMETVNAYLSNPAVLEKFPADILFKWGVKGDDKIDGRYYLYAIKVATPDGKAPLDGSVVTDARERYAERGAAAEVEMTMNGEGTREWGRLTGENIGKCVAIVLDGYVYSAPRVQTKIDKGTSQITGDFTIQEAKDLANVLKSGKVPAPATIIQDTVVGPSLGQESINAGMLSFAIAFVLVLLYMGLFYKTAGWMSDIALLTNVFLLMGVLVSFGAVLTLPGIAGIVLTMGMAVDANVIIFERVKEELRGGKGLALAIKDGFSNAYSAIIDGNLTTIITGLVLFFLGTGPVKGFATTLIIGIITSLFCSIFITRLLLEAVANRRGKVAFSRKSTENFLSNIRFSFIDKRKYSYILSGALLLVSVVSLAFHGLNQGIEFTGGRTYVIGFDRNVDVEQVRHSLEEKFAVVGDAASSSLEVKQFGGENQIRVATQYAYDRTDEEANNEVDRIMFEAVKGFYADPDFDYTHFKTDGSDKLGIISSEQVGASIAKEMTYNSILAVLISLVAIGLYIAFRFKKWQWATGATLGLAHNALLVIGLFSLLYSFMPFNLEVNQAFIAAILTIIGYSINDTVVIFDRIREYIGLYPKRDIKTNIDNAICATLSRTVNTSGTTLVTLLAIFIFGGETIRGFVFALILGVIIGTYTSVFIATPIAYDLQRKKAAKSSEPAEA